LTVFLVFQIFGVYHHRHC